MRTAVEEVCTRYGLTDWQTRQVCQAIDLEAEDREQRREYRRWLVSSGHQAIRDFDQLLLLIAGGTISASIAFVKDIVPDPDPDSLGFLVASWILLVLTLVVGLFGLLRSHRELTRAILDHDARREPKGGSTVEVLNWGLLGGIAVGVFLMLVFVRSNL